jgi:alpha 1,6-mannosyltransferase
MLYDEKHTVNVIHMRRYRRSVCTIFALCFIILTYSFPSTFYTYNPVIFPRNIIQTGMLNETNSLLVQSFKQLNPNYTYLFYNDTQATDFVHKHMPPNIIRAYDMMPMTVLKADYFRYISVYVLGGVYSDIDTECLRPIDTWHDNYKNVGFIVAIEAETKKWESSFARPLQLCQWTFAARPKHPILSRMIQNIARQTKKFFNSSLTISVIFDWAGPGLWTDTIFAYLKETYHVEWRTLSHLRYGRLIGDVYILPITAFGPNNYDNTPRDERSCKPRVKHHFYGSWRTKLEEEKE